MDRYDFDLQNENLSEKMFDPDQWVYPYSIDKEESINLKLKLEPIYDSATNDLNTLDISKQLIIRTTSSDLYSSDDDVTDHEINGHSKLSVRDIPDCLSFINNGLKGKKGCSALFKFPKLQGKLTSKENILWYQQYLDGTYRDDSKIKSVEPYTPNELITLYLNLAPMRLLIDYKFIINGGKVDTGAQRVRQTDHIS